MTKTLSRRFASVLALDISQTMLDKARAFIGRDNVTFLKSDGANVPAQPNSADVAFSYIVYQHFPSRAAVETSFKGVWAALKPGALFKVQIRGVEHHNPQHWSWGPHYTEQEGRALADRTGFITLNVKGAGERSMWLLLKKPDVDRHEDRVATGVA